MPLDNTAIGYLAAMVAVLSFGSNFVPVKKVNTGDGVFFQFIMCNAIFATSFPVLLAQGCPKFHPLAMLGGALWCTGNMMCGPIIELIGLSLGLLIWGSTNMVMGWATGTFGLFGLNANPIATPTLNFIGIAFCLVGLVVYLQIKSDASKNTSSALKDSYGGEYNKNISDNIINYSLLHNEDAVENHENGVEAINKRKSADKNMEVAKTQFGASWSVPKKRLVGFSMSALAGFLFGISFNPSQYVIDNDYGGNYDTLNMVFPHFCGIILASWTYMVGYVFYNSYKNTPMYIPGDCILPAIISGSLWGIAEIAWFVANKNLGFSVSFPIITSGPGFIGAMWGVFYFKEISGKRNLATLAAAFCITLPGLIMIALSH